MSTREIYAVIDGTDTPLWAALTTPEEAQDRAVTLAVNHGGPVRLLDRADLAQHILDNLPHNHLDEFEQIIRDMAGNVASLIQTRSAHPSYGTTKKVIMTALHQLEGCIGAYMVLSGQAAHPFLARAATFRNEQTTNAVDTARAKCAEAGVK